MRFALDAALETGAVLDDERRQRIGGNRRDIVGALVEALVFTAIADRPAHLPGKLRHDLVDISLSRATPFSTSLTRSSSGRLAQALLRLARARATAAEATAASTAGRSA
jgi:hypothetical protein